MSDLIGMAALLVEMRLILNDLGSPRHLPPTLPRAAAGAPVLAGPGGCAAPRP
jgi:hypothetical protein